MKVEYHTSCKWCRKHFIAHRKDKVFCSSHCKTTMHRITKDMKLVGDFVPEAIVKEKWYPQQTHESLYLQWFRMDGKRYADVYASINGLEVDWEKRFQKIPKYKSANNNSK